MSGEIALRPATLMNQTPAGVSALGSFKLAYRLASVQQRNLQLLHDPADTLVIELSFDGGTNWFVYASVTGATLSALVEGPATDIRITKVGVVGAAIVRGVI